MHNKEGRLRNENPRKLIIKLSIPAMLALMARAIYNLVDTAYIGLLKDELALAAVGVTIPIMLVLGALEVVFASGSSILTGKFLGAGEKKKSSEILSTIFIFSLLLGLAICILGMFFQTPLLTLFGASQKVLPLAKDYAFWMFISAIVVLPSQSLSNMARAESSVKVSSIAIGIGTVLNIILDPIFMFIFDMGVAGASLATTLSQAITFLIMLWFYVSKRSVVTLCLSNVKFSKELFKSVISLGLPLAATQICIALASSITNILLARLPEADYYIAAYGIVQRLTLIAIYVLLGFMQGYQPVAVFAFGAKLKERFQVCEKFALKGIIVLSILVEIVFIIFSKGFILLFNQNEVVVYAGSQLLISQMVLFPAFAICIFMTITFQCIKEPNYGIFLSTLRQGLIYIPCTIILFILFKYIGILFAQPITDVLVLIISMGLYKKMQALYLKNIIE